MTNLLKLVSLSFTVVALQLPGQPSAIAEQAQAELHEAESGVDGAVKQEADPQTAWLDDYLASELDYDEQQIEEFKSNVADLPDAELRALVESMKQQRQTHKDASRDINSTDRKRRLAATMRDMGRLERAKALAVRNTVPSRYSTGSAFGYRPRRTYRGLFYIRSFRGYRHY